MSTWPCDHARKARSAPFPRCRTNGGELVVHDRQLGCQQLRGIELPLVLLEETQHPFLQVRANQVRVKQIRARHGRYSDYLGELRLLDPSMESYTRRF